MNPLEREYLISLRAPDDFLSGLLSIAFAACLPRKDGDLDTFPAQEGCWYLLSTEGGTGRLTCGLGCVVLESGQAAAVCAESPLDVLFQGTGRLWILCLKGSLPGKFLRRQENSPGGLYPEGAWVVEEAFAALEAAPDPVPGEAASSIAYTALAWLYRMDPAGKTEQQRLPQVVEMALKILQQEFAFLDGIGELAQRLEVSQEYLTRAFRQHMGMTPGKYLNQVRVEQAKLLLRQGGHNVAFVADACGFANSNYFARVFRSMVGLSPSEYARQAHPAAALSHPMLDEIYVL